MRVLELTQRFPPAIGGVEEHVLQLALRLQRSSVDVEVLTTDLRTETPFSRLAQEGSSFPFPVVRVRAWKLVEAPHGLGIVSPSMLRLTLSRQVDVMHAHAYGYFPTVAGGLAGLLRRAALVVTPHSDPGRRTLSKRVFDRVMPVLTLQRASRVIALTRREAAYLQSLGISADRTRVIPNGVDVSEFGNQSRHRASSPEVVVLYVGRLYPAQKGLESLVRAMALLPRALDARLRLVGEDWGGVRLLRSLAGRLGLQDRITILGRLDREALLREYANADLFVLPSLFEPFGIVLLEAMASGLPVVATRVGGIPEVVVEGRTGLLVDPDKPEQLAESVRRLCQDEGLRHSLGRAGRERAKLFSWETIAAQTREVYSEALQDGLGR